MIRRKRNILEMAVATALFSACAAGAMPVSHAAQATGASKLQEVLKRGKLVVGTGTTNPPWHFEDDSGNLTGMDIDMARLLAKGLFDDPTKVEFVRQAADARIPNLLTNKIDIVAQFMTITPGRARQVEFTTPYYREGVGLLVLKDSKYKNYDELYRMSASRTIRGWCSRRSRSCRSRAWTRRSSR